ncbi:CDP-glycerol glycerophosphotransferase family protein [Microbacter sp. GSS18]|nr:CDP-glycerol glycerophosphotransferase family protein [Microbacter sp. GSS18]
MKRVERLGEYSRRWAWDDHGSSIGALLTVLAFAVGWWQLGLVLIAVVAAVMFRSQARVRRWAGRFVAPRLILVAALIPVLAQGVSPEAGAAITIVGCAVVAERLLRDPLLRLGARRFLNIPGADPSADGEVASRTAFSVNSIALLLGLAAAAWALPVLAFAAAVVSVLATLALGIAIARARPRRAASLERGFAGLAEARPVFLLHWDGPASAAYQLTMWLPYLDRLGLPYAIVVRNRAVVDDLAGVTDAPVVHCVAEADVERVVVDSVTTVFYVNTALKNAHLIRYNHLTHIQLNHGDSDKPASASKAFRMFDVNFVAGRAAIDRFAHYGVHVEPGQAQIVGRPQVEAIERADARAEGAPTVLYAPTWGGYFSDSDFCSLPVGAALVQDLLDRGCRVVFRPHPLTARNPEHGAIVDRIDAMLAAHASAHDVDHAWGVRATQEWSIVDCMNASDAMIADVSSTVTDYLFSEKPLAMMSPSTSADAFVESYAVAGYTYVLEGEPASWTAVLDDMFGDDSMRGRRRAGRDYYLGDFSAAAYADAFVEAARDWLRRAAEPAAR